MVSTANPRYREPYQSNKIGHPMSVGMCRYCRREMWNDTREVAGLLRAAPDGITCDGCRSWLRRNPGGDPLRARSSVAERIPAELPETDAAWRDRARCRDTDPAVFEPDPDPDDRTPRERDHAWHQRHYTAARVCDACPVLERCRATALDRGYEGLWGGLFITRQRWKNLITGESGWTIHVTEAARREHERALDAARRTKGAA